MKKIDFWTPYIGNVGTIKATINSAAAIKKYSKEYIEINLFKIHREWEGYENDIKNKNLKIIDFGLKKYFNNIPKYGFLYRISMFVIMIYSIPKLVKHFNEAKPDVIMAYLQGMTPLLARMFSTHKPKIILSIQGLPDFLVNGEIYDKYPLYKKIESKIRNKLWKILYLKADFIITLTTKTQNELSIFLNEKEKILFISNPVINDTVEHLSNEQIQDELFLQKDFILGIGRYTKQKDFYTLIKAFKRVSLKYPNINLVLLGEGEERENLQKLIYDLELTNNVFLYGFVNNPYKYLKQTKLFVLSSLWEDPGHVLMEAAYLKTPIVATNCPNDVDLFLSYGKAGYLCQLSNEKDMAVKIIEAFSSSNKTEKIDLAYQNSLMFTEKTFYERIVKCF